MRYKTWFGMKTEYEDIVFNLDDMFRVYSASDRQGNNNNPILTLIAHELNLTCIEYNKFHKNIRIVVDLSGNTSAEVRI
jgi:hypothetical protein